MSHLHHMTGHHNEDFEPNQMGYAFAHLEAPAPYPLRWEENYIDSAPDGVKTSHYIKRGTSWEIHETGDFSFQAKLTQQGPRCDSTANPHAPMDGPIHINITMYRPDGSCTSYENIVEYDGIAEAVLFVHKKHKAWLRDCGWGAE